MHRNINSQIYEVMEVEITEKRKKGRPRKSLEECVKKDLEQYGFVKRGCVQSKEMVSKLEQRLLAPDLSRCRNF